MGALKPGYLITSDLTLVRRLGGGGMGTVWVASHAKLKTDVVVKCLSESLVTDEEARERFSREVTATVQVRSPHVVQMLDHGITEAGIPYLVMELLEGRDLAKALRERAQLRADEVQHVVDGVAAALTKAHERGVVHRDIKPANVFLCTASPRPFVKVVDFGIAKRFEDASMTATHAVLGTPAYMSPEQLRGSGEIDHRTDLWALGILVYHTLTGAPPFRGAHLANIAKAILNGKTPLVTPARPDLPPEIDAWMARALSRDAAARFSTALEMAESLAVAFGDLAYLTPRQLQAFVVPTPSAPLLGPPSSGAPGVAGAALEDGGGGTFGPSAITHAPYSAASRLKWWVMGAAALGVLVVGVAFRLGYGLRANAGAGNAASEAAATATSTLTPALEVPPVPVAAATPATATAIGTVIGASPASPPVPAVPARPAAAKSPAAPSSARPPRGSPRPAGKKGHGGEDDIGF